MRRDSSRRPPFRGGLAAAVLAAWLLAAPSGEGLAADGTYLVDYRRTNSAPAEVTVPPGGSWREDITPLFYTFRPRKTGVISSPVIDGGSVFVGSPGKRFSSFDLATGKTLWNVKTDSRVDAPATAAGEKVLVGTTGGSLYCLERGTGSVLWRFEASGEVLSAPVVSGDKVFFNSADGRVYALTASTGEKLWTYTHKGRHYVLSRFYNSPALYDGVLTVLFPDGHLAALEADTGRELWKRDILGAELPSALPRRTPLATENGLVYAIDGGGTLLAIDIESGETLRRYGLVEARDFIVSAERIYILGAERLVAADRRSGSTLWVAGLEHGGPDSMLLAGSSVFVLSSYEKTLLGISTLKKRYGHIASYSAGSGREGWGRRLGARVPAEASAAYGSLALVTEKGKLVVFGPE